MSKRDYRLFLSDIKKCCDRIQEYLKGKTFNDFLKNQMMKDAVIRNLEIIGEASKKIPENIRKRYPEIEWKKISGFRDVAVHDYFGIDYEVVWDIVQKKIPDLSGKIQDVIEKEG